MPGPFLTTPIFAWRLIRKALSIFDTWDYWTEYENNILDIENTIYNLNEKTGFVDGSNVNVSMNTGPSGGNYRNISITNTGDCLNKGVKVDLLSADYTSPEIDMSSIGKKFLYSVNGAAPAWSNTSWSFEDIQIAILIRLDDYIDV